MDFEPDFDRLRIALFGGQPDRVPLLELAIADAIMEKFLGKPVHNLEDKIEFYQKAGYDYIRLSPKLDMNPGKARPREGERISTSTAATRERSWHASGKGSIQFRISINKT